MPTGHNNKLTGQIGEFLVCAELGRRGLIATPFAGNFPAFDILAADELCRTAPIQVKASSSDNWPADARHWMNIELDEAKGQQIERKPVPLTVFAKVWELRAHNTLLRALSELLIK